MKIKCLFVLFAILMISITSCKKKNNTPKDETTPQNEVPKKEITLDKTTVLPGDIINLKASFLLDKSSWDVKFGEKNIKISKVNDSTAMLSVPYLPAGSYGIDLIQMGIAEKKTVNISNYTPITNPEEIVGAFKDEMDDFISEMDDVEFKTLLSQIQETFDAKYALLSEEEKKELAFGLQRLNNEVSKLSALKTTADYKLSDFTKLSSSKSMLSNPFFPIKVPLSFHSDNQYCEGVIACGSLAVLTATLAYTGAHGMAAPTGGTQLLGLAAFSYSFYSMNGAIKYFFRLKTYKGEHRSTASVSTDGGLTVLSVNRSEGKNGRLSAAKTMDAQQGNAGGFVLKNGSPYNFVVQGKYASLSTSTSNAVLKEFLNKMNTLTSAYSKMAEVMNSIKSWFSSEPAVPPFVPDIPATSEEVLKDINVENISIENISDPEITINKSGTGTDLILTATSTTVKTGKEFKFDVVYKQPVLNITTRRTVNATFDGAVYAGKLEIVSGNSQTGELGKKLSSPFKVKVTDSKGALMAGVEVKWVIKSGNGSLSDVETITDGSGMAQVEYTVGTEPDNQVEASVSGKDGMVLKSMFGVEVKVPQTMAIYSGDNQTGENGKKLANPLRVVVKDNKNSAIGGVKVEWNIKSGGGVLNTGESVTNSNGIAQVEWTLGNAEKHEVEAIAKKADGSFVENAPLRFTASTGIDSLEYYKANIPGYWVASYPLILNESYLKLESDFTGTEYRRKNFNGWLTDINPPNPVKWSVEKTSRGYEIYIIIKDYWNPQIEEHHNCKIISMGRMVQ